MMFITITNHMEYYGIPNQTSMFWDFGFGIFHDFPYDFPSRPPKGPESITHLPGLVSAELPWLPGTRGSSLHPESDQVKKKQVALIILNLDKSGMASIFHENH